MKDARDNTFTGGLTYTPDYVTFKNSQNTTQHFSIASGYSRVSVSESDFSYTFSMKVPVKDQPTAFAISDVNLRADVLYIDTLSNAAPEYVEEFQIANPDDLYVYYGEVTNISFSPDPELNDLLSDRTLWQTSPSTAVIIGYVEE